jgi:hypothetical protein
MADAMFSRSAVAAAFSAAESRSVSLYNRARAWSERLRSRDFGRLSPFIAKSAVFGILSAIVLGLMVMPSSPAEAQFPNPFSGITEMFTSNPNKVRAVYEGNLGALTNESVVGCWGCKIFDEFSRQIFSAGNSLSGSGGSLAGVIIAVASLFSLVYIGQSFVSGDASDLLSRWKVFWQLMIAVAIGTAWLTTGGGAFANTWKYIYDPLMSIPLATSEAVSGGVGGSCGAASIPGGGAGQTYARESLTSMRQTVCGGHKITMKGIAFGIALAGSGDGIIGSFLNLLAGFAVILIFGWVAISFPLRFIDVLIRLTVVGIITPILVVCATFRPTRSYIQIGISNVLYAGAVFALTSIMFKLGSGFFDSAVDQRVNSMGSWNGATMIADSVVVVGTGVIFSSMLRLAPSMAAEFSQFRGSGSPVGDGATNFASTVTTLPVKAAAAIGASKIGGAAAGKAMAAAGGGGGGAAPGTGASLGKGVSKSD